MMPGREDEDKGERLDEELRKRLEEYTEEDRAFLEEMRESIREFNE